MSVYSGFGTRQQESTYTKALYNTLFLLQLRIFKLFKGEKFDDIKFGKVLTKLYARLYTMEQVKYLPPKYSFAMKDLAEYLGIFEITEDQIKQRGSDYSETSSNKSYMTQSAFKPKNSHLDVIREHVVHKEEEEDEEDEQEDEDHSPGPAIAKRVKRGVQNRLAQNAANQHHLQQSSNSTSKNNSNNTTMTSSVLHNTGNSIIHHQQNEEGVGSQQQQQIQSKIKLQKSQINYQGKQSTGEPSQSSARTATKSLPPPGNAINSQPNGVNTSGEFQTLFQQLRTTENSNDEKIKRKPSQQSDRMSMVSGRTGMSGALLSDAGQKMVLRQSNNTRHQVQDDYEGGPPQIIVGGIGGSHYATSHREQQMLLELQQNNSGIPGTMRAQHPGRGGSKNRIPFGGNELAIKNANERSISSNRLPSKNHTSKQRASNMKNKKGNINKQRMTLHDGSSGFLEQQHHQNAVNTDGEDDQQDDQDQEEQDQEEDEVEGDEQFDQDDNQMSGGGLNVDDTNFKVSSTNGTPMNRAMLPPGSRRNINGLINLSGSGGDGAYEEQMQMYIQQQNSFERKQRNGGHNPNHLLHHPGAGGGHQIHQGQYIQQLQQPNNSSNYHNMAAIYNQRPAPRGAGGQGGKQTSHKGGEKGGSSSKRMKSELQNHQNALMQQYMMQTATSGNGSQFPPQMLQQKFVQQQIPSQPQSALRKFVQ